MNRSRTAAVSLTALLALGGTTATLTGLAAAQTEQPTTVTTPSAPTDVTLTLPGLGDIAMSVDSSTGAVLSITVTPIDGVTVGDPVPVHHGVLLDFTLADGTVRSVVVEVRARDGAVKVEVEPADDDGEDGLHGGPPPVDERGESADHRNDDNEHSRGLHLGTSTTTTVDGGAPASAPTTLRPQDEQRDQRQQGRPSSTPSIRSNDED